jgi:hypothetical protein
MDFLVTLDRKPWFAVEAKLSATTIEPSLAYFRDRLRIPWVYQVVLEGKRDPSRTASAASPPGSSSGPWSEAARIRLSRVTFPRLR